MKIVRIVWADAWYQGEISSAHELSGAIPLMHVGVLLDEDEDSVWIGGEQSLCDPSWRYVRMIPRVNIVSMETMDWPLEEEVE